MDFVVAERIGRCELLGHFEAHADPVAAEKMSAYLRDQFPFYGIPAPLRRQLQKPYVAAGKPLSGVAVLDDAEALWALPRRELHYVAVDDLKRWSKKLGPEALPRVRELIVMNSWWDTVDSLAAHVVGGLVRRNPELGAEMEVWARDENLWVARTAVLHQLRYGEATDAERLFSMCRLQSGHQDFFMRKAIGWALRQYGRTAPDAVRSFVRAHEGELSGLSTREALKNL